MADVKKSLRHSISKVCTCTCTRLEVRQRTDCVGVVPSKTRSKDVCVLVYTKAVFKGGYEVFYLPIPLAGVEVFWVGLFSRRSSSRIIVFRCSLLVQNTRPQKQGVNETAALLCMEPSALTTFLSILASQAQS